MYIKIAYLHVYAGLDRIRLLCNVLWLKYITAECALSIHVSMIQHRQLIRLRRCSNIAYSKIFAIGMMVIHSF